jgi:hypothetical protein
VRTSTAVRRTLLMAILAAGLVAAPAGWLLTDRLESDNAFCIACHLSDDVPLHQGNYDDFHADFRAAPPVSLAAAHGAAGNPDHPDGGFRCIDCHGGTGLVGKARVKLLSARDALVYVTGPVEEPEGMAWPLLDADCRRCHDAFDERVPPAGTDPLFHELAVHNAELGVACVSCHLSHERGALARHDFLHPAAVRRECAGCHPELFEEGRK